MFFVRVLVSIMLYVFRKIEVGVYLYMVFREFFDNFYDISYVRFFVVVVVEESFIFEIYVFYVVLGCIFI